MSLLHAPLSSRVAVSGDLDAQLCQYSFAPRITSGHALPQFSNLERSLVGFNCKTAFVEFVVCMRLAIEHSFMMLNLVFICHSYLRLWQCSGNNLFVYVNFWIYRRPGMSSMKWWLRAHGPSQEVGSAACLVGVSMSLNIDHLWHTSKACLIKDHPPS